jgi:hypothetical protein
VNCGDSRGAARNSVCTLDIAANSRIFSLAAMAVGARTVHVFELLLRICDSVRETARLCAFERTQVWPYCVGTADGEGGTHVSCNRWLSAVAPAVQ